jgi:eukaryotic-like serine/threonine-protein kinase
MQPLDRRLSALRDSLVGRILRGSAGTSYYLRERISEGGQGWVFKANWDEPGGIVVIVKVLRPDAVQSDALSRFQREADVLRMLSTQPRPNPYIVRFFDHAVTEVAMPEGGPVSLPFTVLEYVPGSTLEAVLLQNRGRGLAVERVRRLGRQAVQALELVHSQNVVHRDLKPSNILLAVEGGAEVSKITDFGIVKRRDIHLNRTMTLAGASLGYAPPEQYEQGNDRVSPKTDLFSLAAILWEMLAGQMAFPFTARENALLIVTRILNGPRPSLARVRSQLAPELAARPELIRALDEHFARALAADPADRDPSVSAFWSRIEPALREASPAGSEAPASMLPFASTAASPARQSVPDAAPGTRKSPDPMPTRGSVPQVRVNPVVPLATPAAQPAPRGRAPDGGVQRAAWVWRVISRSIQDKLIAAAVFSVGGDSVFGAGPRGLLRWGKGAWVPFTAQGIDAQDVQGARILGEGELLLFGRRSLAARISERGAAEIWNVPWRDVLFHAAYEHRGTVTLVGERPARVGSQASAAAAVQLTRGSVSFAVDAPAVPRLNGVTRLASGVMLAVGDAGTLARLDRGQVELLGSVCQGHLTAIEALSEGGALTVGGGGHALYISPQLEAHLEAVQTTRDFSALTVTGSVAWAGAAQARLLRREETSWVRMSGELGISPRIVSIWVKEPVVRAVCDDGCILEGRAS